MDELLESTKVKNLKQHQAATQIIESAAFLDQIEPFQYS